MSGGPPLAVHGHGHVCSDEAAGRAAFLPGCRRTFAATWRERSWPSMSHAAVEAKRSIELFGARVAPLVAERPGWSGPADGALDATPRSSRTG